MNEISVLQDKTNYSEEQCKIILEIVKSHKVVGRKNKEKIMHDFMQKLVISYNDANILYNVCSELVLKNIIKVKRLF